MANTDYGAFDALDALVVVLDPAGCVVHWNLACERAVACTLGEARGRPLWSLLMAQEDTERARALLARAIEDGRPVRFESAWAIAGEQRMIAASIKPLAPTNGQIERLILTGVDVTHIHRYRAMAEALRASKAELERAQSVAKIGSFWIDVTQNAVVCSKETHRIFGTKAVPPLDYEAFLSRVHPEDRERVGVAFGAALRGAAYDIEHRTVVGDQIKWVHAKAEVEVDEKGGLRRMTGVVQDITAEKAASEQQRASRARLDAIVSISSDAIISIDDDQRIVLYNEGAEHAFGWTRDEVLGRPLDMLIPERSRAVHRTHVRNFAEEQTPARPTMHGNAPVFGLRKTGEEFPAEATISKVDVHGGRLFTVILRDISDRWRYESALRLSEERLRVALQASPAIVFSQDTNLRYTWIHNPSVPLSVVQIVGRTDLELLPRREAEPIVKLKRRVLETGEAERATVQITVSGQPQDYDVWIEALRDGSGTPVGLTGAAWNVTDLRREEARQRFLVRVGRVLLGAAPDYETSLGHLARLAVREMADFCVVDVVDAGEMRRLRVACADASRASSAEALAHLGLDRSRPHLTSQALCRRESTLLTAVNDADIGAMSQGPEHHARLRAIGMRSLISAPLVARGRLLGAIALISSRPSRAYGADDLRFAEKLAAIAALAVDNAHLYESAQRSVAARDEILGIVAHDLRTPLNTILLQLELMSDRNGEANLIARAANRMNRLIGDMLDVARLEGGGFSMDHRELSARDLLAEVLDAERTIASAAKRRVDLEVSEPLPAVRGDRDRLVQVFDNLVANAIKFSPEGSVIVVGAKARRGEVLFWVRDRGRGIAAQEVSHLFDRFWQSEASDRRGAGLGLAIVEAIVRAHGGHIWVDSDLGRGTTFFFTVPRAKPRIEGAPASA